MKNYLSSFNLISAPAIELLVAKAKPRSLKKGDFFMTEGKVCKEIAFIKSGILRSFYTSAAAEEFTYCIAFPHQFMTAYTSLITGLPSQENIQTMSPVELLILDKHELDTWAEEQENGMKLLKTIAEQQYLYLEKRVFMYQKDSAKARYLALFESHPEYIKQIPMQYLASFLAITPRHLSRLRKEVHL